jgi:hypothetical protein
MTVKPITTIGRIEEVELVDFGNQHIVAKVDTGADVSSIWASGVVEEDNTLSFVLFDHNSPLYTGRVIRVKKPDYRSMIIANSFGGRERRYVVKLRIRLRGRLIKAQFSLANRASKPYPVLLGRKLLHKKFLVDVSKSLPLDNGTKTKEQGQRLALQASEG